MLITNSYVIVIAMDFSKAFDTMRHVTLLVKMANLDLYQIMFSIGWSIFSVSDNSCKQSQPVSFREAQLVQLAI